MGNILKNLGVNLVRKNNQLEIDPTTISIKELPYEIVKGLRASFFCIGALLTKLEKLKYLYQVDAILVQGQ